MKFFTLLTLSAFLTGSSFAGIIRGESRSQVFSIDQFSTSVGQIEMSTKDGKTGSCSATIISKNLVLTAAHCVINMPNARAKSEVIFYPNRLNKDSYAKKLYVKKGWVPKKYIELNKKIAFDNSFPLTGIHSDMIPYDIAILEVFDTGMGLNIEEQFGSIPYRYATAEGDEGLIDMSLYSYPADKSYGTLWEEDCFVDIVPYSPIYRTSCDIVSGASGSGVRQFFESSDTVAISGVVSSGNQNINYIAPITEDLYSEIKQIDNGTPLNLMSSVLKPIKFESKKNNTLFSFTNNCHAGDYFILSVFYKKNGSYIKDKHFVAPGKQIEINVYKDDIYIKGRVNSSRLGISGAETFSYNDQDYKRYIKLSASIYSESSMSFDFNCP